jgi:hypothetical protein
LLLLAFRILLPVIPLIAILLIAVVVTTVVIIPWLDRGIVSAVIPLITVLLMAIVATIPATVLSPPVIPPIPILIVGK